MKIRIKTACAIVVLAALCGCASLMEAIDSIPTGPGAVPLDEATVAAGLREALQVGTGRAVDATSRLDGFLTDELIRIAIPARLRKVTDTMRSIGLDGMVDELEVGMNRAAERASGEARTLFLDAVRDLTIQDAFRILNGDDDAATSYLRERTGERLRARVHPIVTSKMDEVGLSRAYDRFVDRVERMPLVDAPSLDLDEYVTEETLGGIFTILAREEARIREDPVARTTELLRRVFAAR